MVSTAATLARGVENSSHYHRGHAVTHATAPLVALALVSRRVRIRRPRDHSVVERGADRGRHHHDLGRRGPQRGLRRTRRRPDHRPGRRRPALVRTVAQGPRDDGRRCPRSSPTALGLEESMTDIVDAVESEGVPVVRVGESVDTIRRPAPTTHADESGDDGHGNDDPHIWFDPTRVAATLPAIADALVAAGLDRAALDACVADVHRGTHHARQRRRRDRRLDPRRAAVARHQPRLTELLRRPLRLRDPRQRHPVAEFAERHEPGRTRGTRRRHRGRPGFRRSSPRPSTRRPTRRPWPTASATWRWSPSRPTRSVSPAATPPPTSPGSPRQHRRSSTPSARNT